MKKQRIYGVLTSLLLSLCLIFGLCGCAESNVTALKVSVSDLSVEVGKSVSQYVTVTANETFTEADLQFISDDESIATVQFDKISLTNYVYFKITGISAGTTHVYFKSADGLTSSEKITVTVTEAKNSSADRSENTSSEENNVSSEAPSSESVSSSPSTQKTETTNSNTVSDNPTDSATSETSTNSKEHSHSDSNSHVTVPDQDGTGEDLVWVPTNGGTKYHSKSTCSNMKDPVQVSRQTAVNNGFGPCGKCKP